MVFKEKSKTLKSTLMPESYFQSYLTYTRLNDLDSLRQCSEYAMQRVCKEENVFDYTKQANCNLACSM